MTRALRLAVALSLLPTLAAAEPFEGAGYLLVCGEEGCFLGVAGFTLFAPQSDSAAMAVLTALDPLSAVQIAGDLSDMGDSSATITLSDAAAIDNPDEGNLRALQGRWRPLGEATPFHVEILGLDWLEIVADEEAGRYRMTLGPACADGVVPGGTAISLYPYGGDPAAVACWQVDYIDDASLILRDFQGDQGSVEFFRLTE